MPSNSFGSWVNADYKQVDDTEVMRKGDLYAFKKENEIVTVAALTADIAHNLLMDVGKIKKQFLKAYKDETGENGEVLYIYVSYEQMAGAGYARWIVNGYNLVVLIRDVGLALTASVIIALAIAVAVIGITITSAFLIFHAVDVIPDVLDPIFILVVLGGVLFLAILFLSRGKFKFKTKKGEVKTG